MWQSGTSIAEIRQLCHLGLALSAIATELIDALAYLTDSAMAAVLLPDAAGRPERAFFSSSVTEDVLATALCTMTSWEECKHEMAALLDLEDCLCVPISDDPCHGAVFLGRRAGAKPYSDAERRTLRALEGDLGSLFGFVGQDGHALDGLALHEAETGMAIVDTQGHCGHLCPGARYLRQAIIYPNGVGATSEEASWLNGLRYLAGRVLREHDGEIAQTAPVWYHENLRGRFELRAYYLTAMGTERARIAVCIRRLRPLSVHFVLALSAFHLSPRQRDIALLLAGGLQVAEAAGHLGLGQATVAGMVKDIYHRLNVNSRQAFRETLLAVDTVQRGSVASQATRS